METLSHPVVAHNLAAWFILAPATEPPATEPGTVPVGDRDYAVLEEAIAAATAIVHETGTVRELLIENTGEVDLFIQAGDIVKGGRQDRSIGTDFIVPVRSGRIPLPAFCVEQARWHQRKAESALRFATATDLIASKKAHLALRLAKDQHAVWESVAEEQQALGSALGHAVHGFDSPSSLQLTYEHDGVRHALEDYTTILESAPATTGGRATGVVWAINGVPSHADQYATPRLFAKLWRKLLRAAATEAIGAKPSSRVDDTPAAAPALPTAADIAAWLDAPVADSRRDADEEHLPPRTRLRTRHGDRWHRFEAFDVASSADMPVHVAVLAR